jgi:multidrug efflux pump subunit AcrA (membrane-fusion protein)
MRRVVIVLVSILVLALLGSGGWWVYGTVKARAELASQKPKNTKVLRVAVERIMTKSLTNSVSITGEIETLASVNVIPKVSGRLEKLRSPEGVFLEEGVVVRKGQVIAVIEHGALEAAKKSAEAAVLGAKIQAKPEVVAATIQQAKAAAAVVKAQAAEQAANFRNVEREKDRMLKLCQQGSCTEQMRDKAMTAWEAGIETNKELEAQLARAEATVALAEAQTKDMADAGVVQAEAALKQAQVALSDATLEAPIDGVIGKRFAEEGDMVSPGKPIVRIVQIDTVKAIGSISEKYVGMLVPGKTPAELSVDAYPRERFGGVVSIVGVEVDRATRTVTVEVRVANADHRLRSGMFARMNVIIGKKDNVTVVPESAVVRLEDKAFAYVVNDRHVKECTLTLGLSQGVLNEVIDGLNPGDMVIVRGQRQVKDGAEVVAEEAKP